MKKLILLTLLLLTQTLMANQAILQLDTKGHTAMIRDIIVTKSGDIISASDDKTIRVWSSKTGKEKRKILGQIGAGSGEIFAIALSPNEEFLAVGGFMANFNGSNHKDIGRIRIYNYKSGRLISVLKSHSNVVQDLAFSKDGKYLISGSADKTAKIWSVGDWRLLDTIKSHTNDVYAVKIIKKQSSYFAITAGYDNQISLYDMQKKKRVKSHHLPYKLKYLATSKNYIAVCGTGREIKIYDYSLMLTKTIKSETVPKGLAYSPNGDFLIAGSVSDFDYELVNIYSVKNHYQKIQSFKKHKNLTQAVAFLDNQTAVSGGGDNNEIYIWSLKSGRVLKKIEGVGEVVWSVGIRGETIGWGNDWLGGDTHTTGTKLQKTINLKSFKILNHASNLKKIATQNGRYSLIHKKGGDYGYADAILEIQKDGKKSKSIVRGSTNGYRHNCYGFYRDYIVSGGSNGFLKIYNLQGKEVANLVGHTGEVLSIALDGDRLVSGSGDQTIRVWDLSALGNGALASSNGKVKTLLPTLNLFISKNNEYIAWSKSGYYSSSVDGDKYVGYHINQGANKEAYFVSASKYRSFYRPDIIEAIVERGSEEEALALVSKTRKVQKVDIVNNRPPILSLLSPSEVRTSNDSITIRFDVDSPSEVEKIIVMRNGEKISKRGLGQVGSANSQSVQVALSKGENIISIKAKNRYALSDEVVVTATKTGGEADIYKPTLYLLSVGVSKYANSEYNLAVADKDALSVAKMFKAQEGRIYKKVVVKKLINQDATKDNIIDGLEWLEAEVTQRDVAVIFIAGHGENDNKNNYYFVSHDGDFERLRRTSVKWVEIKESIEAIPSKIILLVDTCRSGNVTGSRRRGDITGAIKSIVNSESGAIIMSASTGKGYSIEREEWGHGAFTKALLEGLDNSKADYNHNQIISIKELDLYLTNRVKELTNGEQKPTTKIPENMPDFAFGGI